MKKSIVSQVANSESIYLGIDFGQAKIGLAIADEESKIAFSWIILPNDGNFSKKLKQICEDKHVQKIIVGIPTYEINQDGKKGVERFVEKIQLTVDIAVELENEMFTTKMAQNFLKEKGCKNISSNDDSAAARIILQSWLDRKFDL